MRIRPDTHINHSNRSVTNDGGDISGTIITGDNVSVGSPRTVDAAAQEEGVPGVEAGRMRLSTAQIVGAVIGAVAVLAAALIALFK